MDHQFQYWNQRGHPVCLCVCKPLQLSSSGRSSTDSVSSFFFLCFPSLQTDDKGVFSCVLSGEYHDAGIHYSLSPAELFDLSLRSIDFIFEGEATKQELRTLWLSEKEKLGL